MSHFHQTATTAQLDATRSRRSRKWLRDGCALTHGNIRGATVKDAFAVRQPDPRRQQKRHATGEWRPIRRPRRPEHSRSRHQRTAKHLQPAAFHSRPTDLRHPASTVGGARTLSTPDDSRPPSSTKRYAVADAQTLLAAQPVNCGGRNVPRTRRYAGPPGQDDACTTRMRSTPT